jgi:hypothetical protein
MFPTIPINQGLSPPEIQALDAWNQKLMRDAWNHKKWPLRIYHYTNIVGFKGIVETGVLHGTHVGFTNDFQEYKHAANLALQHAEHLRPTAKGDATALLDAVCANLRETSLFGMHPYGIACFSEHPDKLSQWRAYGRGEGGIAIGFDTVALVAQANRQSTTFGPVIYTETAKQKIVAECFDWMLSEYPDRARAFASDEEKKAHLGAWVWNWAFRASFIAPMVKNSGFEEEDEWRLVRRFALPGDAHFIAKNSHLCPYLELHVGVTRPHPPAWPAGDPRRQRPMPAKLPIVELWFGPGRYQEHAHASCKAFLEHYDYGGVNLYPSKTPFRSIA